MIFTLLGVTKASVRRSNDSLLKIRLIRSS